MTGAQLSRMLVLTLAVLALASGYGLGSPLKASAQRKVATLGPPLPMAVATGGRYTGESAPGDAPKLPAGYVEQEYLVSGTVTGRPYTTTLLIRRPADPRRFSGLVVVEPVHVAGTALLWQFADVIAAGGHGYALVGTQRGPLERTIKPTNPARYASVKIPALPPDNSPLTGVLATAPPDLAPMLRATETEAPISHAILAQVGAMLKRNAPGRAFGGMRVRWLVTGGVSQTGQLTLTYLKNANAIESRVSGRPIFDGYLPLEASGDAPVGPHPGRVVHAIGEADYLNYADARGTSYRRADSDAPGDRYRLYEIAGASHVSLRDAPQGAKNPLFAPDEHPSRFPSRMLYAAALDNLIRWVMSDRLPPHAAPLTIEPDGHVGRDRWGNALGGVRSSYLDVPIARYRAVAPKLGDQRDFARRFYGVEEPFGREVLKSLYPTHGAYVAKVRTQIASMVAGHWLLRDDAAALLKEAQAADIP